MEIWFPTRVLQQAALPGTQKETWDSLKTKITRAFAVSRKFYTYALSLEVFNCSFFNLKMKIIQIESILFSVGRKTQQRHDLCLGVSLHTFQAALIIFHYPGSDCDVQNTELCH